MERLEQPQTEEQEDVEKDQQHCNRRQRTIPVRYGIEEYVDIAFIGGEEQESIEEALDSKLSKKWKEADDSEYHTLHIIYVRTCVVTERHY